MAIFRRSATALLFATTGCLLGGWALAADPVAPPSRADYERQIKPVLTARCLACHGVLKQNGGLRLDTGAFIRKGGNGGPAVRPGNPAGSPLLRRVQLPEHGGRMPPEGEPLKPEQIEALRLWIQDGAPSPVGERSEQDPRDHWSFRPVRRPAIPTVRPAGWVRNPVDAFVRREHQRRGLLPQPEAPRIVLVRRLYLDLVGVPPSPTELDLALTDGSSTWYERLVDRLLEDPRHGERWGRHWMDVWRYSDWWGLGEQLRNSQPHIWHWRDWIVESLNQDLPYDEMIRQMLAADELYPNDLKKLRATGYLARNWFLFNRNQWMEETVEHLGKGLLGLTINCAKCHDHKYDPIAQADFYRLRAFFEPYHVRLDMVPGQPDLSKDGIPRPFDAELEAPTYLFVRGQESRPDKSAPLSPGVPSLLAFAPTPIQPVRLPVEAWQPERRAWVIDSHRATAADEVAAAEKELAHSGADPKRRRLAELRLQAAEDDLNRVEAVFSAMQAGWTGSTPVETRLAAVRAERRAALSRAEWALAQSEASELPTKPAPRAAAQKALDQARATRDKAREQFSAPIPADAAYSPLIGARWSATRFRFSGSDDPPVSFPPTSTGRRTALAHWITDRRNPLTARVAVNQIWSRHLGVPLAPNVFDFGRKSAPPSHPELLDWLASEFVDSGWSLKRLHRLIVTSATYRLSSSQRGGETSRRHDPDNRYYWRREPQRLEAEAVRDSILALAGTLDSTRGGPPVPPADQNASRRRSLYFFHSDISSNLFLSTFDAPSVQECYRRDQSIVPQQALALSHSELALDAAGPISDRLTSSGGDTDDGFLRRAFAVVLGIEAGEAELQASRRALQTWRSQGHGGMARAFLVRTLLNHNDFVTVR